MKKDHVQLMEEDRAYLEELTRKGEIKVKTYNRALGLLELDRGKTYIEGAKTLQMTLSTVSNWAAQYEECLDRRIPTLEQLEKEALALVTERDAKQIKIHWQFSIQSARSKLNSRHVAVCEANKKFKET